MLERDFAALPILYSENELEYLKGSDLYAKVKLEQKSLIQDYGVIVSGIPEFGYENTVREFFQAYASV